MSRLAVYVDKENTTTGVSATKSALSSSISSAKPKNVGKSFHVKQKPVLTSRRALGDVNSMNHAGISCNVSGSMQSQKDSCKKMSGGRNDLKHKRQESVKSTAKNTEEPLAKFGNDEIENMIPYDEFKEDNFEDIWPVAERPSEFTDSFRWCRPWRVFSHVHYSDSEDLSQHSLDELFRVPSFDDEHAEVPIRDVSFPELDISVFDELTA